MNMIIKLLQEIFLYLTFSLVFSITIMCTVFTMRTRDTIISHFLGMLIPTTFLFLFHFIYTYILATNREALFTLQTTEILSLFGSLLLCSLITIVLLNTSYYLILLLPLDEKNLRLGKIISRLLCGIFFFISLFSIILLAKNSWEAAINLFSNDLFLFGTLFLAIHGIIAIIFLKNSENTEKRQLLMGIIYSFMPLLLFFPVDFIFLRYSAFKLTYISYTFFIVSMYLYINRYYSRNYEPELESIIPQMDYFYEKYNISKREKEILQLLIEGKTNNEIAKVLFISINTVKTHLKNIFQKLKITNRVQILYKIKISHPDA